LGLRAAIDGLVDGLPEEVESVPRFVDCYLTKGAAVMVCEDESSKDWLAAQIPDLVLREGGSRLKIVGMDALPTYKRMLAWFSGPPVENDVLLRRLRRQNDGIDTRQWRVYERRAEPRGVRLVLSMDSPSVATISSRGNRLFCGTAQAVFTPLGVQTAMEKK
jgi:hypothetical protein